jgi:hypothetical protein
MTKNQLFGLAITGLATVISCDSASKPTAEELASDDCPVGTFRPFGITDCVFPATDQFNQLIGVSDNRCAQGQPAIPPSCVNDSGERSYLTTSTKCAPGYRFMPGACNRGGTAGFGGGFVTGVAGAAGFAGESAGFGDAGAVGTGFAGGFAGTGGFNGTGFAGDATGFGGAGSSGVAGDSSGAAGDTGVGGGAGAG